MHHAGASYRVCWRGADEQTLQYTLPGGFTLATFNISLGNYGGHTKIATASWN